MSFERFRRPPSLSRIVTQGFSVGDSHLAEARQLEIEGTFFGVKAMLAVEDYAQASRF
jgi:hypothetical protein